MIPICGGATLRITRSNASSVSLAPIVRAVSMNRSNCGLSSGRGGLRVGINGALSQNPLGWISGKLSAMTNPVPMNHFHARSLTFGSPRLCHRTNPPTMAPQKTPTDMDSDTNESIGVPVGPRGRIVRRDPRNSCISDRSFDQTCLDRDDLRQQGNCARHA